MPPLSIIMPAHNEAENIDACVRDWHEMVVSRIPGAELLVVDDCSRDGTGARLQALAAALPALRVLRTPVNGGHGPAVRFGLERCTGTFVFQTDSDRQHHPEDFWPFWEQRHEIDFAFGVRQRRADGMFRLLVSQVLRGANAVIWKRWIRDANCPFKLMRRTALERLLLEIPRDSFIPMVMVSVLARHHGYRVAEIAVRHFPRAAGEHSLKGLAKWTRTGSRCARELVALRRSMARGGRKREPQASAAPER